MALRSSLLNIKLLPRIANPRQRFVKHLSTENKIRDPDENIAQTHFGYETVDENVKSEKVYEVFEKVADSYDQMNDAMSFGIHRVWKHTFVQRLNPPHGTYLLDVAGGSGDIAFRYLDYLKKQPNPQQQASRVTVCDINEHMLNVGKKRAEQLGYTDSKEIDWVLGDAENLPVESESVSAYTISFGIRNVTHIEKALDEAYRVLQPGGRFMCLEFSHIENEILKKIYDSYSFTVIPVMGQIIAGEWKPYQYLVESIRKFPNQETFKSMIQAAGFRCVTVLRHHNVFNYIVTSFKDVSFMVKGGSLNITGKVYK